MAVMPNMLQPTSQDCPASIPTHMALGGQVEMSDHHPEQEGMPGNTMDTSISTTNWQEQA